MVKSFPGLYFRVTSSIEQVLSIGRRENLEDDIELMTKLHLLLHFYVKLITVIKKKFVTSNKRSKFFSKIFF